MSEAEMRRCIEMDGMLTRIVIFMMFLISMALVGSSIRRIEVKIDKLEAR